MRHVYVDGSCLSRWHTNSFTDCLLVAVKELHMDHIEEVGPLYFLKTKYLQFSFWVKEKQVKLHESPSIKRN